MRERTDTASQRRGAEKKEEVREKKERDKTSEMRERERERERERAADDFIKRVYVARSIVR